MRIISGKFKGKKLYVPNLKELRPTTDFAKKGLFDILSNRVNFENLDVLDLFSGSGYISFEFISRNAKSVTAVEKNKILANYIKKNAKALNTPINVITGDALKILNFLKSKFDIIFCDPPFNYNKHDELLSKIFELNLLKPRGILIIEHYKNLNFSENKYFIHSRNYGKIYFSFFSECKTYF
ncbi:MAG: 16S rRNA (guanine(966)-N(2))-methyltransferase RsmD [Bacteroidales bacterium]|nr:16S rRNA (guanine(966)-N(2))-methyltransferase RsmD [Bacteroidales bacterium]